MVEFAYNKLVNSSTKFAPFFAYMGCHSYWTIHEHPEILKSVVAADYLLRLKEIIVTLSHHLHDARATHKKISDCHHLDASPKMPKLQVEDCVCGDTFYIGTMDYTHIETL